MIASDPTPVAISAPLNAESPSVGLTFSSCTRMSGAGIFPELSSFEILIASSLVNPPEIWALPSQIASWITAAVACCPQIKIDILLPMFPLVI